MHPSSYLADFDAEKVIKILQLFIKEEVTKVGFKRVIIGLSGGIDSTVVAYLAVTALGPRRVLARILPYKTSSPESTKDAIEVSESLGIPHKCIDVTPLIDRYISKEEIDPKSREGRLRVGNLAARARMIVLYDHSQKYDAIVLGTSNKSELLMGYGTLYGDLGYGINPLGDLYKTQVYVIGRALGIADKILGKVPTADLWRGQTDEGELGFTYDFLDELLYNMVDLRMTKEDLIKMGYKAQTVEEVWERMRRNQFKRLFPIIPKLSARTIGKDFLYLRDWGT